MTRKTKVVSKFAEMVDMVLKVWCALMGRDIFKIFQSKVMSICS
ncbi:hypothetical protein [Candidatus Phycorickettsia trachydisci]|nr:hypothetical protein [Candidatus Phycorickettsia trachydisci]